MKKSGSFFTYALPSEVWSIMALPAAVLAHEHSMELISRAVPVNGWQ